MTIDREEPIDPIPRKKIGPRMKDLKKGQKERRTLRRGHLQNSATSKAGFKNPVAFSGQTIKFVSDHQT